MENKENELIKKQDRDRPVRPAVSADSNKVKNTEEVKKYLDLLVDDIFIMMNFARKMGIPLPELLQKQISELLYHEDKNCSGSVTE